MNERTIFMEALEKETPAQRSDYLDAACAGDAALRQRLEALLRSHEQAGNFLGKPPAERLAEQRANPKASDATQADTAADDRVGEDLGFLAPSDRPDVLGRLGHYEILEVLGRGGMGVVLRAFDEKLHRVVAIKVLAAQLATSGTARKRFTREAHAAAAVCHDHVVTCHAVDEANGLPYLVMQYVDGLSLQQRLDQGGPLQLQEILRIGMQTAAGLAAAHAQGLVHRDIKPANILLENGVERVKITDFGLARAAADASLTQSGVVAGTPHYMAPEQAKGEALDARTDLFSLGSVLYAMCTGQPPFRASGTMAVLKRVCEETPTPIRETNPEIPEWLVAIIDRLHAKDPAERFQSAAAVAELLGRHLAHVQHPSVAPVPAALCPLSPEGKGAGSEGSSRHRRRRWAITAAALLLCMVGGLGLTEATGVTNLRGTVIRIFTPDGTLVVEVGDPSVKVTIEGDGGLVITGAGPQEVRLRPGSYRVQAARDGKRVPLERELVSIAKGGREVVKVKLEGPLAPAAAKAEKGAFVLLVGGKERKFDTLAEAVAAAQSGDTIEIRGNGPFVSHPIKVQGQALVIRAADGFRPVLHLSPEGIETYASLLETNAPLVLEGLEFHLVGGKVPSPSGPPEIARTVRSRDAVLHVANCRFLVKGEGVGVSAVGSPICELRNCELLSSGMLWWRLGCKPPRGGQILVHNSLLVGGDHGLAIWYEYPDLHDITIRLADNTFAPRKALSLILSRTPDPISADRKKSRKPFRVEALANVFDEQDAFLQIEQPSELLAQAKAFQPAEIEALVPRLFDWYERHNHYPAAGELLGLSVRAQLLQPTRPISVLPQWKQFWGLTKIDAQQGRVRYQTSDVLSRIVVADKEITPRDFRLAAGSPGKGARPGGRDPGIDPDLVGPGLAYERWKKMPAYQQWRQDTGQVKKAKGPKAEKPFVVTGGQAVAERKFNSLAEAAAAASGGGTIEIRGNGPFISLPLQLGGKALTIRAAAGYCPVLQLREPTDPTRPLFSTSARLVLEGLEIRSLARPSGAEAFSAATVVISRDAPLRIANCRLLLGMEGEGTNLAFNAYKVPDLELRNCQFILGPHCSLGYWHCPTGGRLTAEGNVMAASLLGRLTILVNNMKSKNVPTNVALRWTRNTVLMGDLLSFELSHIPELAGGGGKQPVTPCRLEASENLFDTTQAILTLSQNQPGESEVKPLPAAQADALVRYLVTWQDQCNGFPEGVNLLGFDFDGEPLPTAPQRKTLADWQAFWGLKDTRSVQGRARYQGGDLRARLASAPEQLTAGDFRLHPNSTGRGAGVGGRDLGADVDLVGPGTAYERWKKTPAYQQWRKDTGQEKK